MNRRQFLTATSSAGTLGLAGCLGGDNSEEQVTTGRTDEPGTTAAETASRQRTGERPTGYVGREGPDFSLDGDRYVFSGVANCCLAEGYTSAERVRDVLDGAADLDADAVRFKIGSAGGRPDCGGAVDGCNVYFQPEPGTFNETAFEHLDYIVDEAAKRGMRVILPLVDNWGETGMDRYVAWSDTAEEHDDFYTDEQVQEWYRGFIDHLLTRENSRNGREYREDPAILMWELANEPRFEEDYDGFLGWVEDSAAFIHDLDGNHLVSTGSDIYQKSEVYEEVHAVNGIDACSIHLWPQNWGWDDPASFGTRYITDRVERGTENVKKPVYLGEYGWWVNLQADGVESQLQRRTELFSQWHDTMLSVDIDGAIAWELLGDSRLQYHRGEPGKGETVGFACPQHSGTCAELRSFAEHINQRSAV